MFNTSSAAGLIAHIAFWIILGIGLVFGEIRARTGAVFVVLWALGVFGISWLSSTAALFVTTYVAILAIVLTLFVFKGDVRLS